MIKPEECPEGYRAGIIGINAPPFVLPNDPLFGTRTCVPMSCGERAGRLEQVQIAAIFATIHQTGGGSYTKYDCIDDNSTTEAPHANGIGHIYLNG